MSHYHHFTIRERESILLMLGQGKSIRYIAKTLNRSPSSISRELKRNGTASAIYSPEQAQKQYRHRRKKCCRQKILKNPNVRSLVLRLFLQHQWSPEEVSGRLKDENNPIKISYSTIYRGIYSGLLETHKLSNKERGNVKHLRHKGKRRHKKGVKETRGKFSISHPIEERPKEAKDRSVLGHFEGDTVAGKNGGSCFISVVDRKSRYLLLKKIPKKTSVFVRDGLIELLKKLPKDKLASVTPDRGKEFSRHSEVTEAMDGLPFYFPRPRAPWERGTNENTNGLIREYFPKSVDLDKFDDSYVDEVALKLNLRPRKCLGWKTPYEVFFNVVLHLT